MSEDKRHKKIFSDRLKRRLWIESVLLHQKIRRTMDFTRKKKFADLSAEDQWFVYKLCFAMELYHGVLFESMERLFTPEDWQKDWDGMGTFIMDAADQITR